MMMTLARTCWMTSGFALLLAPAVQPQTAEWEALQSLKAGVPIVVRLEAESFEGSFRRASSTQLFVVTAHGQIAELDAADVRAVHQVVPGPLVRRMIIGSAIAGGIMFYPCYSNGVLLSENPTPPCLLSTFGFGAGFGLLYHLLKGGRQKLIYVASDENAPMVGDWRGESSDALTLRLIESTRS